MSKTQGCRFEYHLLLHSHFLRVLLNAVSEIVVDDVVTLLQEILSEMLELLSLHQNLLEYFVNGDDVS